MDAQRVLPTPTSSISAELVQIEIIDLTDESSDNHNFDDNDAETVKCSSSTVVEENEESCDAPSSAESSGVLEDNSDSGTIIISDDDEDEDVKKFDPDKMECHRCIIKKQGVWKDQKRFLIHIKRHVVAGQFNCIVCHKPFIKLGQCLKHERNYHRNGGNGLTDDNVWNISKNAQKSTAIYPYRGPKVSSILDSYAIQLSGNLTKKASKINEMSKLAVKKHKDNVKLKRVEYKLGKITGRGDLEGRAKKPVTRTSRKIVADLENNANDLPVCVEANGA